MILEALCLDYVLNYVVRSMPLYMRWSMPWSLCVHLYFRFMCLQAQISHHRMVLFIWFKVFVYVLDYYLYSVAWSKYLCNVCVLVFLQICLTIGWSRSYSSFRFLLRSKTICKCHSPLDGLIHVVPGPGARLVITVVSAGPPTWDIII